jgi:hypothetical protein
MRRPKKNKQKSTAPAKPRPASNAKTSGASVREWWKTGFQILGVLMTVAGVVGSYWMYAHRRSVEVSIAVGPTVFAPDADFSRKSYVGANIAVMVSNHGTKTLHIDSVSLILENPNGIGLVTEFAPDGESTELKEGDQKRFIKKFDAETLASYRVSGYSKAKLVVRDGIGILKELPDCERLLSQGAVGGYSTSGKWVSANVDFR